MPADYYQVELQFECSDTILGGNGVNESAGSGLAGLQNVGINCCSVGDSAPAGNSSTVLARTWIMQVFAIRYKILC